MFTRTLSALAAAGLTIITLAAATPLRSEPIEDRVEVKIADLDLSSAGSPDYRLALRAR